MSDSEPRGARVQFVRTCTLVAHVDWSTCIVATASSEVRTRRVFWAI